MELRCHSLMMGYKTLTGKMVRQGSQNVLFLNEMARTIHQDEYIQNGFHITDANRQELEAMIAAGYESKRVLLRFYDLNQDEDN